MANKKSKRVPNVSNTDLNECASVYTLYLMACSPSTVNLAKRLIAKNNIPIFSCKKLYERIPKKFHLFFDQMRPATFENFLIIARAAQGATENVNTEKLLFEHYQKNSKEYRPAPPISQEQEIFKLANNNGDKFSPECIMRYSLSFMLRKHLIKNEDVERGLIKNLTGLCYYMSIPSYGCTDWNELTDNSPSLKYFSQVWQPAKDEMHEKGLFTISILEHDTEFVDAMENSLVRHNINVNDFYKELLTQKEVQQVVTDILSAYTINLDILDELDEDYLTEDDDDLLIDKASKALDYYSDKLGDSTPLLLYATAFEILAKMYSSARDIAIKGQKAALDASIAYDKEQQRNVSKEHKLAQAKEKEKDKSLAEEKQKQLNYLQSKYETLQSKYDDVIEENKFLRSMLENEDNPQDAGEDDNSTELDIEFPEDAILFGGHPNWQRKFSKKHPKVRILSGVDPAFDESILRGSDVIMLNSRHMKHSVFYKVRRLQQRFGFKILYIANSKQPKSTTKVV